MEDIKLADTPAPVANADAAPIAGTPRHSLLQTLTAGAEALVHTVETAVEKVLHAFESKDETPQVGEEFGNAETGTTVPAKDGSDEVGGTDVECADTIERATDTTTPVAAVQTASGTSAETDTLPGPETYHERHVKSKL